MPAPKHRGLSPSSLSTLQSCARKYWHKKIAKTPHDPDFDDDVLSLNIGKAFHKVLELTRHDLSGVKLSDLREVTPEFNLTHDVVCMIYAMLASYKEMHEGSGLSVVGCETAIETDVFYGIVDAVMTDKDGGAWVVDMKTSASYSEMLLPTLASNPQLNLYVAYWQELARVWGLAPAALKGARYRLTTKSRIVRKEGEGDVSYIERLRKSVRSFDFAVPVETMQPELFRDLLQGAKAFIDMSTREQDFWPNYSNCTQWHRPCEFFSRCHKKTFTVAQS